MELTYSSNAIEGNTLTRKETAVVVEKGLTVSGKSLFEHLEATNHARALHKVLKLAEEKTINLTERAVLDLHETVLRYIDSLELAQLGGSKKKYYAIIAESVNRSFDIYLKATEQKAIPAKATKELLRIGQLAKLTGETNATLRFWTKTGLLDVAQTTDSN